MITCGECDKWKEDYDLEELRNNEGYCTLLNIITMRNDVCTTKDYIVKNSITYSITSLINKDGQYIIEIETENSHQKIVISEADINKLSKILNIELED